MHTEIIETLNSEIDRIHDQHPKGSKEYRAISDLNKSLFHLLKADTRPDGRQNISRLLEAHRDQPALLQDMINVIQHFTKMLETMGCCNG
ncbi:hypothetical protein GMSM_45960 [Geomonas sp. Red276]